MRFIHTTYDFPEGTKEFDVDPPTDNARPVSASVWESFSFGPGAPETEEERELHRTTLTVVWVVKNWEE
jgi:hypothetical protein